MLQFREMHESPKPKRIHVSIRGGNPVEFATLDSPRLDRNIRSIYDVISEKLNASAIEAHVSMLPEAGTYSKRMTDNLPESLEEAKIEEKILGASEYPDDLRLNTRSAEYISWEDKFKLMCSTLLKRDNNVQEVHLTVDTWSLGTAFFVKFLSEQSNRQFLIDNRIHIKGIHFIAPTVASGTSFAIDELSEDLKAGLREFLNESKHNIYVTGNKSDQILEGKGQEFAEEIARILDVNAEIEDHSQNDRLTSHYVADSDVINRAVMTSIEMVRQADSQL